MLLGGLGLGLGLSQSETCNKALGLGTVLCGYIAIGYFHC